MPTIGDIAKKTPSLSQIANLIKSKAVSLAPKRTGNLKRQLDTYNRPSGMVKQKQSGKKMTTISFTMDVSPPGAEYGKFWNDPNVSWQVKKGGKPENINFADKALEDPQVQQMIDKVINDMTNEIVGMITTEAKKL